MVDYKKYIQVLQILKSDINRDITGGSSIGDFSECTDEQKASAICDLFDTQKTVIIGNTPTIAPKLYDVKPVYDLNRVTCVSTDNEECDMSPNDFQSCGCPKGVTCPGY